MLKLRVGHGFDVHPFVAGRPLILGGVTIPFAKGLQGHSDADVIIHAVVDALLGAASMADIGHHFSDQDAQFKNIDSRIMLRHAHKLLQQAGWFIHNIDVTLLAEVPKIAPYKTQIISHLAEDLQLAMTQVNIKATTSEKLGFVGREEGMACMAVALLQQGNL